MILIQIIKYFFKFINSFIDKFFMWLKKNYGLKYPRKFDVSYYLYFLFMKLVKEYTVDSPFYRRELNNLLDRWYNVYPTKKEKINPVYIEDMEDYDDDDAEIIDEQVYWDIYMDRLEDFLIYFKAFFPKCVDSNKREEAYIFYWRVITIFEALHTYMNKNKLDNKIFYMELLDLEDLNISELKEVNFFEFVEDAIMEYLAMYERAYRPEMYDFSSMQKGDLKKIYLELLDAHAWGILFIFYSIGNFFVNRYNRIKNFITNKEKRKKLLAKILKLWFVFYFILICLLVVKLINL